MRNNLKAEFTLCWSDWRWKFSHQFQSDELLIPEASTSLCDLHWNCYPGGVGWAYRIPDTSQGSEGDSATGWLPLTNTCYLPPSENMTYWEPHSQTKSPSKTWNSREGKARTPESHRGQQIPPEFIPSFYTLAFLLLLNPTVLYEVGKPAKGQMHPKASLEQKYFLRFLKKQVKRKRQEK